MFILSPIYNPLPALMEVFPPMAVVLLFQISIKNDAYYSSYLSCEDTGGSNCDFYASTYLGGDPNDGNFDSGDQGFGMLHEETVQYVNSLATAYAFQDNLIIP